MQKNIFLIQVLFVIFFPNNPEGEKKNKKKINEKQNSKEQLFLGVDTIKLHHWN